MLKLDLRTLAYAAYGLTAHAISWQAVLFVSTFRNSLRIAIAAELANPDP